MTALLQAFTVGFSIVLNQTSTYLWNSTETKIAQALIAQGADLDAQNINQSTALMMASAKGHLSVFEVCFIPNFSEHGSIFTVTLFLFFYSTQ